MKNIKQKGFTLIELLVVVAMIGILATIALASLNSARTKAKCASGDEEACSVFSQEEIDELTNKKTKPKDETNLDRAKRICPDGILEFTGNPDDTWGYDFEVKCK